MPFMPEILLQHPLIIAFIIMWTLPWKGAALWRAARLGEKGWFVAIFVINTLGILEIMYIFIISKKQAESHNTASNVHLPK
jgi:hypothetical protein